MILMYIGANNIGTFQQIRNGVLGIRFKKLRDVKC